MKKRQFSFLVLLFLVSIASHGQEAPSKKVNFTGVEEFWTVHNLLQNDTNPDSMQWEKLFHTPYYAHITQSTSKEYIKKLFRIAYQPSQITAQKKLLAKGGYTAQIIGHLQKVGETKHEIINYVDSLRRVSFFDDALSLTAEYLPQGFIAEHPNLRPHIAFGIFEPDGKANAERIAVDIAYMKSIEIHKFMAHEAHHFFISEIRRNLKPTPNADLSYLLRAISQLHLEGIADLIDKKGILKNKSISVEENWYAFHYNKYYDEAKETFSKIDSLLVLDRRSGSSSHGKKIWDLLHFGTHPEAMHMAILIESTFGKAHMIGILDNPFKIFWSYQEAVLKKPDLGHVFSKEAISYLKQLEAKYLN